MKHFSFFARITGRTRIFIITLAALGTLCFLSCSTAAEAGDPAADAQSGRADYHGTCYEIFVRSFYDSDGDGIGDLEGVMEKLDYINDGDTATQEDLGCDMIWLMPVFPSPTYHKYDVTDYCQIDPQYGSLADMDRLVDDCHVPDDLECRTP